MKSSKPQPDIDPGIAFHSVNLLGNSASAISALKQNIPIAIIIWSEDFEILEWDGKADAIFAHPKQQVIGKNLATLLFDEAHQSSLQDIWQAVKFMNSAWFVPNRCVVVPGALSVPFVGYLDDHWTDVIMGRNVEVFVTDRVASPLDPDGDIPPNTPFEKLPADWVCPVCGATKDQFEKVG